MNKTIPACPRCKSELLSKQNILFCVKHGVLLRLTEFKKMTSRSFSQFFWVSWYRLTQKGGVRCPDCLSRMIILNPHTNKEIEIDCCSHCYAIWLDRGEAADLHLAFLDFKTEENSSANKISEEAHQKSVEISKLQNMIAQELIAQDERIQRYQKLTALGESLTRRVRYRFIGSSGSGFF